jgi:hypothetical protein
MKDAKDIPARKDRVAHLREYWTNPEHRALQWARTVARSAAVGVYNSVMKASRYLDAKAARAVQSIVYDVTLHELLSASAFAAKVEEKRAALAEVQ